MLGNFHDDVINIECETSSADLYVVDADGKYIENIAMHSYLESDVIDAINAKYGTNFTQLTMQKVTGIAIGDDCPNWNAYEKIEILSVYLKIPFTDSLFAAGLLEGSTFYLYGEENDKVLQIKNENGEVANTYEGATVMLQTYIIPKIREKGYEVENSIIDTTSYNMGDFIPNWEQYINVLS